MQACKLQKSCSSQNWSLVYIVLHKQNMPAAMPVPESLMTHKVATSCDIQSCNITGATHPKDAALVIVSCHDQTNPTVQALAIYGTDVFRKWDGRKHVGAAVDVGLWDTIMLTLEAYSKADLQRHSDTLQADLLKLKLNPKFVTQPKDTARSALSKSLIESRIRLFQTSIEVIIGAGGHVSMQTSQGSFCMTSRCTLLLAQHASLLAQIVSCMRLDPNQTT